MTPLLAQAVFCIIRRHRAPDARKEGMGERGKSPTIIDASANLGTTAERLTFSKLLNAGQTCIAPDYALVPRSIQAKFVDAMKAAIVKQYPTIDGNPDYNSIVSDSHAQRLHGLIEDVRTMGATIVTVGHSSSDGRMIAPTLIVDATAEMSVMQEEIFGPVLPIVDADTLDEAIAFIHDRDRPLAPYWFGNDGANQRKVLAQTISGGVCINDAMVHCLQEGLPFGGVGASGMGHYHGEHGFKTFSKEKPVFFQSRFSGASMVYPPFTGFSRRFVNIFQRIAKSVSTSPRMECQMKAYLTKWVPPRDDFLQTITEREKELFQRHGDWQTGLREIGQIVAHGPVIDPTGSYGVAIWEIEDSADIAALTAQDPIVQGGVGHYEHFPMLQMRARG